MTRAESRRGEWLTAAEVARKLKVPRSKVYRLIASRRGPFVSPHSSRSAGSRESKRGGD
ncbi:MAG: helix-turn-helix domain-containing protein [Rubrobacteraceae bacterium]|nr:helix-turn-helix domain-containing protein [Rubrobacteraceae bacterium]MCL6439129.1 helix-turn-helix domain-containing protein [Rubrobacteraceae bacterium]